MGAYMFGFRPSRRRFLRIAFWQYGGSLALVLAVMWQSGWAQANISDWKNVEALAPSSGIWVRTTAGKNYHGKLVNVTDEKLSLNSDEPHFPGRRWILRQVPRARVKEVRRFSQEASMALGAAIGGAVGVGIGAGIDASTPKPNDDPHAATMVLGMLGALLGSAAASSSTIIKGKTIYRAP